MSWLSKGLKATGLNQPGKFLAKAAPAVLPGGAIVSTALAGLAAVGGGRSRQTTLGNIARAGGASGIAGQIGGALIDRYAPQVMGMVGCPKGYHQAKDGSGKCVRNRRMNPANGRAIRRATSRLRAAEKMFRRVLKVEGKHTGKITPKGGRKR